MTTQATIGEAVTAAEPEPTPPQGNGNEQEETQSKAIPPTEIQSGPGVPMVARRGAMSVGNRGIELRDLASLWQWAGIMLASGLAPAYFKTRESIAVAIQMGLELGLLPMMATQNIAVINGKPGPYGAAVKGMVEKSGLLEEYEEFYEGTYPNDDFKAVVISKRKGRTPLRTEFSIGDAKTAKLWQRRGANGQDTPWVTFPKRMLMWRARQFNYNDNFPDVTKGFHTAEELEDSPELGEESKPIEMPKRASEAQTETAPA